MNLTDEQKSAIAESVLVYYDGATPYLRFCPLETDEFRHGLSLNLRIDGPIEDAMTKVIEYLIQSLESLL